MRDFIVDRLAFLVGHLENVVDLPQTLFSPVWEAHHDFRHLRKCVGFRYLLRIDDHFVRAHRSGKLINRGTIALRRALACSLLVSDKLLQGSEVVLHCFVELRGRHPVSLLNCLFDTNLLVLYQIEVCASRRQLVLVQDVVHHHPRLCVEQRVMRTFLITGRIVAHAEQVGY